MLDMVCLNPSVFIMVGSLIGGLHPPAAATYDVRLEAPYLKSLELILDEYRPIGDRISTLAC